MSIQYTADQLQRKFQGSPEGTAFARIAEVLRNEGRHEEAIGLCQAGMQRHPGNLSGHLVLGKCFVELERLDEARDQFETALRLDPRCLSAMHWLARIMTRMQWNDAAAAYYRSILEIEPWDEEAQARLVEAGPAPAIPAIPAIPATASLETASSVPPFSPPIAPPSDPSGQTPGVEEFNLDSVADFLPSEPSSSDLAGALEEVTLEDALSAPARETGRSVPPAAPEAGLAEPMPMDVLSERDEIPPKADEPAPISGDDVGERLDSLFGTGDEIPATVPPEAEKAVEAPAAPEAIETPESESPSLPRETSLAARETADLPSFTGTVQEPVEEAAPPESPDERVSGEDIEHRLDELFSLAEATGTHAVLSAPEMAPETEAEAEAAVENPAPSGDDIASAFDRLEGTAPSEGVTEASGPAVSPAEESGTIAAAEPAIPGAAEKPEPETAKAESALPEIGATEAEPTLGEPTLEEQVTGQDVADKLDALFGAEPAAKPASEAAPEPPDMALEPQDMPSRTAEEGLEPPPSGSASWAAARPAEEGEAGDAAARDREDAASTASVGLQSLSPWEEGQEAEQPPAPGLMTTESMLPPGIGAGEAPAITGEDIEDRLDSLFNIVDEGTSQGASLRTLETSLAGPENPPFAEGEKTSFIDQAAFDTGTGEDRTVVMPAMRESAAEWPGRQGEESRSPMEPGGNETMMLPSGASQDQDPLSILGPDSGASGDALFPAGTDTVGLEMVDGADIAERLDQIFAPEGESASGRAAAETVPGTLRPEEPMPFGGPDFQAAAEEAIAKGGATAPVDSAPAVDAIPDQAPALETGEMPLDEVTLFAQDSEAALPPLETGTAEMPAAETVLSGEDVSARLTEIFSEPPAGAETTGQPLVEEEGLEGLSASATWTPAVPILEESPTDTVADATGSAMLPKDAFAGAASGTAGSIEAGPSEDMAAEESPAQAGRAGTVQAESESEAGSSSLSPMLDEEEAPLEDEEENAPQSAAGANVATVTLAEIYFQQGLREQALQIYRQLLEREPGNESVRKRILEIEASKPESGSGPGTDPRRPRPGLKVPKRKK